MFNAARKAWCLCAGTGVFVQEDEVHQGGERALPFLRRGHTLAFNAARKAARQSFLTAFKAWLPQHVRYLRGRLCSRESGRITRSGIDAEPRRRVAQGRRSLGWRRRGSGRSGGRSSRRSAPDTGAGSAAPRAPAPCAARAAGADDHRGPPGRRPGPPAPHAARLEAKDLRGLHPADRPTQCLHDDLLHLHGPLHGGRGIEHGHLP